MSDNVIDQAKQVYDNFTHSILAITILVYGPDYLLLKTHNYIRCADTDKHGERAGSGWIFIQQGLASVYIW